MKNSGRYRGDSEEAVWEQQQIHIMQQKRIPLTRASSGVIVAHLMPTLYFRIASAASIVTRSSVVHKTVALSEHDISASNSEREVNLKE